jgi:hypothetical protein
MIRILFYGIIIYLVYKLLKRLVAPAAQTKTHVSGGSKEEKISPYDKNNVEDIDYEDV